MRRGRNYLPILFIAVLFVFVAAWTSGRTEQPAAEMTAFEEIMVSRQTPPVTAESASHAPAAMWGMGLVVVLLAMALVATPLLGNLSKTIRAFKSGRARQRPPQNPQTPWVHSGWQLPPPQQPQQPQLPPPRESESDWV